MYLLRLVAVSGLGGLLSLGRVAGQTESPSPCDPNQTDTLSCFALGEVVRAAQLNALVNEIRRLRAELATLQANPVVQMGQDGKVGHDRTTAPVNRLAGPHIVFTGANVHIQSGAGATDDQGTLTGLGNLIVGYNEASFTDALGRPYTAGARPGSHNLVVGPAHTYSRFGGLVAGAGNTISGDSSTVSGGEANTASGLQASVSGGGGNTTTGQTNSISGGFSNSTAGDATSVSGGAFNTTNGNITSVSGGAANTASGFRSSVSGGAFNTASGDHASVSGGEGNKATGIRSSVSGGIFNTASGQQASVSGSGNKVTLALDQAVIPLHVITGITVNGGQVTGPLTPGSSVQVGFTWSLGLVPGCPGCITQLYVGFAGGTGSCINSSQSPASGNASVTWTAPTAPGSYVIAATLTQDFTCIPTNIPVNPTSPAYMGVVTVQ